jgi:hypothetical protein
MELRRGLLVGIGMGVAFGGILVVSRALLGGRPIPFWLENTAGVWFVAAFVAGALVRRAAYGALAGVLALLLALVLHDSIWFVTDKGFSIQLIPAIRPAWAVVSSAVGSGVGLLGGWSTDPDRWWIGVGLLGGLVVGEPVALFVLGAPHPAFHPLVGVGQAIVGVGSVLTVVRGEARLRALMLAGVLVIILVALELVSGLVTGLIWG